MDESGSNVLDDAFPTRRRALVEQSGSGIPERSRAATGPSPVAIQMQHDPRFVTERSGEVHHHGIHADDEIQLRHAVTERHDIRRADILSPNFGSRLSSRSSLQREEPDFLTMQALEKLRRDAAALVPVADLPDHVEPRGPPVGRQDRAVLLAVRQRVRRTQVLSEVHKAVRRRAGSKRRNGRRHGAGCSRFG